MLSTHKSTAGFTLFELMTALVMMTILAATLIPVFSRAGEKAWQVACSANLGNIAAALRMYAADYSGHFPPPGPGLEGLVGRGEVERDTILCPTLKRKGVLEPYLYRAGLGDEWPADEAVVADPFSDVHNGGATFGFVDGHTKWYPCEQLQAGREPEGLRDLTRRQRRLNPAGE